MQHRSNGSKTEALVKKRTLALKLTPEQYNVIEQRAGRRHMSMSAWMRSILMQAANGTEKNGFLRIREPDGEMI